MLYMLMNDIKNNIKESSLYNKTITSDIIRKERYKFSNY